MSKKNPVSVKKSPPPNLAARREAVESAVATLVDGIDSPLIRLRHRVTNLVTICEAHTHSGESTDQDWALRALAEEIKLDVARVEDDLDSISMLTEGEGAR